MDHHLLTYGHEFLGLARHALDLLLLEPDADESAEPGQDSQTAPDREMPPTDRSLDSDSRMTPQDLPTPDATSPGNDLGFPKDIYTQVCAPHLLQRRAHAHECCALKPDCGIPEMHTSAASPSVGDAIPD